MDTLNNQSEIGGRELPGSEPLAHGCKFSLSCPVCGQHIFSEPHEICPVCGWEEDRVQQEDPDFAGGANELSLAEAQRRWCEVQGETQFAGEVKAEAESGNVSGGDVRIAATAGETPQTISEATAAKTGESAPKPRNLLRKIKDFFTASKN